MTSMPLTLSRTLLADMALVLDSSKRRTRRFEEGSEEEPIPSRSEGGAGEGAKRSGRPLPTWSPPGDHDWQSSGVRRVSFFSAAYLSAAALIIGLMIAWSASYQSDVNSHLLPFQVCTRAQVAPRWSAQLVEIGRITPVKPSASSFFWSSARFS